ncbi:class I SAM-dependent RNA methyltransferase [Candidatus Saccharibacteria bacterium]|nr:class I SAM-dependent RNA methyltransferase [Candidatus Saccharibacteria bacterium]
MKNVVVAEKVLISKMVPGGQALGELPDGKKGFFWNALPGETVTEYKITKSKSHYIEAIALKIENPSPMRVEPLDECYLSTSPWQIVRFEDELKLKSELVTEVFRQNGINLETECVSDGRDYGYRNKMEYALFWNNETGLIDLAFHMRGSHYKIPVIKSSIERPELFEKAREIVAELNARGDEARKYQSLLLRCNQDGKVSGGLFENGKPHPVFENLNDEILGRKYSYSPNGFFQINLPVYEMALKEISKYVTSGKVLDMYSGVGTIGLSVVSRDALLNGVSELKLVECDKSAWQESLNNIAGLDGVESVLAKSEDVISYIEPEQTVILDPPRAGCDEKLIRRLLEVGPKRVIYLSCNPATQARDVAMLVEKYKIVAAKTFDFFPHTPHIENLVVLEYTK